MSRLMLVSTKVGAGTIVETGATHDALDRPNSLKLTSSGGDPCFGSPLISSAGYLPSGPLASLALANRLTETRTFDARYFPKQILIETPSRFNWEYTVDAVGNPTSIVNTQPPPVPLVENRTFGYQDYQYFLTAATGPWASLGSLAEEGGEIRDGFRP